LLFVLGWLYLSVALVTAVLAWDLFPQNEVWVSLNLALGNKTAEEVMMPSAYFYYYNTNSLLSLTICGSAKNLFLVVSEYTGFY